MLKSIAIVTLVVRSLAPVEPAYEQHLNYTPIARGEVSGELAASWDAPAMRGRDYVVMRPESGAPVYLRIVEGARGTAAPAALMSHGWTAAELLVADPDALERQLERTTFRVIGPPADLFAAEGSPRAMQVLGPADELLYMTRIPPGMTAFALSPARSTVDRVFIAVVGGPSINALREFYSRTLALPVDEPAPWRIDVLAAAHGLPAETRFALSVARMPRDFLVELDEYPPSAQQRPRARGALPGGWAMVSFLTASIDELPARWRREPRALAEFPYSGRRTAVTIGPAGEWIEVIEARDDGAP